MLTLQQIQDIAKQRGDTVVNTGPTPNSNAAADFAKRVGYTPGERKPSLLSKIGNTIASSEVAVGNDLTAGSRANTASQASETLNNSQYETEKTLRDLIAKQKSEGRDTSHAEKTLASVIGNSVADAGDISKDVPEVNKTNLQGIGDVGGVALDVLSAGTYGGASEAAPVAEKTLGGTLKDIGIKTAKRAAVGAGTGYAYDVDQNLRSGETGADIAKPGYGALLGGTIPLIIGGVQAGIAFTKSTAPKFINSLIKPKQADFSYGKDPGRTVSEMGITGNNINDFADNINTARKDVGQKLGDIYSAPENANIRIDANEEINKIDDAIKKASKGGKENQGIVTTLQNIKDALLYEHGVNEDGVIVKMGDTPRDLSSLSPQEAFDLKKVIADQTKFTGRPSDDKTVNSILKNMYGGIKEKLNSALEESNPEITKLNQQYADLTSAELATRNRSSILARANVISAPLKTGAAAAAGIVTALSGGAGAVPVVLAGVGSAAIEKALESTAVKTRIAKWLASETPAVIQKTLTPEVRTVLYRALPKFASQLGQK